MALDTVCPTDDIGRTIGLCSRLLYQDGAAVPLVSPQNAAATLTLARPTGATALHAKCSLACWHGTGDFTGVGDGNGRASAVADEWFVIPLPKVSSVLLKTQMGAAGNWEFYFEINDGKA